jgi:hypothetical protein
MNEHPLEFSSPMDAIVPALFQFQGEVGPLIKESDNEYFHTKYADLAAVLDVVKPALKEAQMLLVQGASTTGGDCVNVETTIFHVPSLQWVRSILTLKPEKPTPQGCGSAITYARRYGLLAMCGIAAEDDDGNSASGRPQVHEPRPEPRQYKLNPARGDVFNPPLPQGTLSAPITKADAQIEGRFGEVTSNEERDENYKVTKTADCWFVKVGKTSMWTRDHNLAQSIAAENGRDVVVHGRLKPGNKAYQVISYVPKD